MTTGTWPADPDLRLALEDALVLQRHPAWTHDDLRAMPQLLLDIEAELRSES